MLLFSIAFTQFQESSEVYWLRDLRQVIIY